MPKLRKRTLWLAAAWLVCQLAALATPIVVNATSLVVGTDDLCTCPGGSGSTACPMHGAHGKSQDDPNKTSVRNSCAPPDAALLSLAGGLGVLPRPAALDVDRVVGTVDIFISTPVTRTELPDSPPPRA